MAVWLPEQSALCVCARVHSDLWDNKKKHGGDNTAFLNARRFTKHKLGELSLDKIEQGSWNAQFRII